MLYVYLVITCIGPELCLAHILHGLCWGLFAVRHRVPQHGACDFLVKPFSFRSFSNSKLISNLNFNRVSPLDLDRFFLIVEFYEHSTEILVQYVCLERDLLFNSSFEQELELCDFLVGSNFASNLERQIVLVFLILTGHTTMPRS